jgi:hypothetical protein
MKSAKARDKKTTLLTYLVQYVRKNCRKAEGFTSGAKTCFMPVCGGPFDPF